jgi:hypothetical protein
MAQYTKGQRVKRVQNPSASVVEAGRLGTVVDDDGGEYVGVAWDGFKRGAWSHDGWGGWFRFSIAPLTPPAEDAWAADQVKKWTKPDPTVPLTKPIRTYSDLVDAVQDQILLWP